MRNSRGAGRKPVIDEITLDYIIERYESGESIQTLAIEYGVSRQGLHKRIRAKNSSAPFKYDYVIDGELATVIELDMISENVHITNYTNHLSKTAFGLNTAPSWENVRQLFESIFLSEQGIGNKLAVDYIFVQDSASNFFNIANSDGESVRFEFTKKDILYSRTDTDGFQLKALSENRKYFVKAQAVISGVKMDDWAVEIIASDLCKQLGINCVEQNKCKFIYAHREYDAVYSLNFEMDGYTFISFERLVERNGHSAKGDEFIRLSTLDKIDWCARELSLAGNIPYEATHKYIIELALVDSLLGNVDRHMRNYGLFYNMNTGKYEIPPVFDNGMGFFEHDPYKNEYKTFDEAMRNVYVSPYGEDPLDMLKMLIDNFDLLTRYPALRNLDYKSDWMTPFAREYINRVNEICQK